MKSGVKFFSLGMLIVAFYLISAPSIFAQDTLLKECNSIYKKFNDNRRGPEIEKYKTAITSGKEYLEKCGNIHPGSEFNNYITDRISKLDAIVKSELLKECEAIYQTFVTGPEWSETDRLKRTLAIGKEYLDKCRNFKGQEEIYNYVKKHLPRLEQKFKEAEIKTIENRFNTALKNKNADEMIAAAKELINIYQSYLLLEDCHKIYQEFKDNRLGPEFEKYKTAIVIGKEYLQKCSNLKDQEIVRDYVTQQIPKIEVKLGHYDPPPIHENRFNEGLKNKNADEMTISAKELIKLSRPYSLDLTLDIASIGFDQASANPSIDKYNNDALTYAKMALQKINEGKVSGNEDKYGFYHSYKTTDCPDGKLNATGWMNYIIGYILSVRQKQGKEALPYLYQATQIGCGTKNNAEAYRLIGAWYLAETIKLNNEYTILDHSPPRDKESEEFLAKLAMVKGHAERALDAYARAYKIASRRNPITPVYKDSLLKKVKELYDVVHDDLTRLDLYLKNIENTPFIDPTTPVILAPKNQ